MSIPALVPEATSGPAPQTISFPSRMQGPPGMANGGLIAGAVASVWPGPVEVTLRRPTPLDRPLSLVRNGDLGALRDGGELLAEGRPCAPLAPGPFPRVSLTEAHAARARFAHASRHPFPHCFVCGTERCAGDGLRVIVGPLSEGQGVASPLLLTSELCESARRILGHPGGKGGRHVQVPDLLLWAALDCPGGWSLMLEPDAEPVPMVLGRMRGQILRRPEIGEPLIAVARPRGSERRKRYCESAVLSADGEVLACAESIWITL